MRFPRAGDSALLSTCPGKYLARGQDWALRAQGVGGCDAVLCATPGEAHCTVGVLSCLVTEFECLSLRVGILCLLLSFVEQ